MDLISGNKEGKKKDYYKRRGIILFIFIVGAAVLKFGLHWWNHMADIAFTGGFFMILTMDSMANEARYTTRETVITDDNQFSFNPRRFYQEGGWTIIEVGGLNVGFWPARGGGEGTIVVPDKLVDQQGENIRIHGSPHQVSIEELPPAAKRKINDEGLGNPYRFTIVPTSRALEYEDLKEMHKEISNFQENLEDKFRRISELEELNQKKFKDLESAAETAKAIKGPSKMDRVSDWISPDDEEERRRR